MGHGGTGHRVTGQCETVHSGTGYRCTGDSWHGARRMDHSMFKAAFAIQTGRLVLRSRVQTILQVKIVQLNIRQYNYVDNKGVITYQKKTRKKKRDRKKKTVIVNTVCN